MQMMIEPQEHITLAINTEQGLDKLRELVDELKDGTVLSIDLSEVIIVGQEDG